MRILLINPNVRAQPDVVSNTNTVPLGLLYIAASLRQAGYDAVQILDAGVENLNHTGIISRLEKINPDLVGITSLSWGSRAAHDLAGLVKANCASCKVVVGGAYAFATPERVVNDPNIDFAVIGEGEQTICELVRALENGDDVSGIAGLAFRKDGVPVVNPPRPPIEDVDSIPFPAWDLLDMEQYLDPGHRHSVNQVPISHRMIPLFTSRGCPYGCIYCHNIFGKRTRLRSVDSVVREIQLLTERYAPGEIEIWDDIFNYDLDRAKRICDEIIRRGIKVKFSFPNGLRADRMDGELVDKLYKAGARVIFYAIETASPEAQARIGKHLDLLKAVEIIRLTVSRGIFTGGFFMLGFPQETKEEMRRTIDFAKETPLHIALFNYVTPNPNTPLYLLSIKKDGGLKNAPLNHFKRLSVNLSSVTDSELKAMVIRAYMEFYLRPGQMWRIWTALPNKRSGLMNIPMLLKLLFLK